MYIHDGRPIYSATDLSGFLACPHLTLLQLAWRRGGEGPPYFDDPTVEALRRRGLEHERSYLARLRDHEGRHVVEIEAPADGISAAEAMPLQAGATLAAMREGADVIYQGGLHDGSWIGRPDFLTRVERPSAFGGWSYQVVDTKLAREAKGGALLQVLLYADLLERAQGVAPEYVHLALGGPDARTESFRITDYAAYFRSIKARFLDHVASAPDTLPRAPDPVEHCRTCAWADRCDAERREADHLSLVAGITRRQREALRQRDVTTLAALGQLALPIRPPLDGVSDASLERVREQARIQLEGREAKAPRYELLQPVLPEQGLAALPEPSGGDLFFDLEADAYAFTHGIEYLFGFSDREGTYTCQWALTREEEKQAFEWFIDLVTDRLGEHPDLHIFHFGAYEASALKRLMGYHATREDELDRLLRGNVFVDLHRVVKQGIRASVERYSIKSLEQFYGYRRDVDLRVANNARAHFEAWLELGGEPDHQLVRQIEGYNRDDCVSALRLRNWLEERRPELEHATGQALFRPTPGNPEPGQDLAEHLDEVTRLTTLLTHDVPADPVERTVEQHARWLLAQLLGFHRREAKSFWWEYYRQLELDDQELIEDRVTLGGLEYVGVVDSVKRSLIHRYRFPHQEHEIDAGDDVRDPATEGSPGEVWAVDDARGTIDLKRGRNSTVPHPRALIPFERVGDSVMRDSLIRIAHAAVEHGLGNSNPYRAAVDLLLRNVPCVGQTVGAPLMHGGETPLDAARRLVLQLDQTVLPIQGPPGAGKTYTAARMIVAALRAGKRVGVTATSHKVIGNLLREIVEAGAEEGFAVTGMQKADEDQCCALDAISCTDRNEAVRDALGKGETALAAGTAWLWSRPDMAGSVDMLFVDEAGQFSLANALAVAPAGESLILLGDPRQLEQPQQGVHPPGSDASALQHLLGLDAATVTAERGLFLEHTYRLHPSICLFTSEAFYEGRLHSRDGLDRQTVRGTEPLAGSGMRIIYVDHTGNDSESPEEVEAIAMLVALALSGCKWIDVDGAEHEVGLHDILIVAPYNAQVAALAARLPDGARVGTVDKFQGQQAPIVIYSMTSSSAEDAPRGMSFLYNPNRLNVATSRAKCLAIVVASPALFSPECRTPGQMRLASAFCRLRELAASLPAGAETL